jgi:hypothetical protein
MNKARLNYWVDVATGFAFVLSAASGLVFLLPSSLADGQLRILGVSYQAWNQLHTWSSLVMVAGALLHVALHWQWVVSMTKKTFRPVSSSPTPIALPAHGTLTRRRLLQFGGLGLASGIALVSFRALSNASATPAVADDSPDLSLPPVGAASATTTPTERPRASATAQPTRQPGGSTTARPTTQPKESTAAQPTRPSEGSTTGQSTCLACPKRISYDRYPGRCRLYVDKDRDGYCDYSIPGSCNNTNLRNAPGSSTPNRRPGSTNPGDTF